MSLSGWLLLSNSVFFVVAGSAFVLSIVVFLLTRANDREKDRELEAFKAEATLKTATLNAEIEQTKLAQDSLRRQYADFLKEVEATKGNQASMAASLARVPGTRHLSPAQIDAMSAALAAVGAQHPAIEIANDLSCSDCAPYANAIGKGFQDAGWTVTRPSVFGPGRVSPTGVLVLIPDPNDALSGVIGEAMRVADIKHDISPTGAEQRRPAPPPGFPARPSISITVSAPF